MVGYWLLVFNNRLLIQFGSIKQSNGIVTITFPIAYTTIYKTAIAPTTMSAHAGYPTTVQVQELTRLSCYIDGASVTGGVQYICIGY